MKKIHRFKENKSFRSWTKILSFCLFSSLVALLLFHPGETARRLGLYGLVLWMGNYSFELARWMKGLNEYKD